MNFNKLAILAAPAIAFAAIPGTAAAQDAGTTVFGNDDAPIGTVESNAEGIVTVDTGSFKAPLPAELLAEREGKWTVNATKAQIDGMMATRTAEAEKAAAEAEAAAAAEASEKLAAALVVGAPVITADAQSLGMVDEIAGGNVVVKTADAQLVTLPETLMAVDAEGALMALANLADIMAAVQSAGG